MVSSELDAETPRSRREPVEDRWATGGASRIEGLTAGYLLVDESEGVTVAELSDELSISRGSISTSTRQLVERGFVQRVRKPGERSHFFVMSDDVWAGFLAAEQEYLHNQRRLAEVALPLVEEGGRSWTRLRNMRDYMGWMIEARLPGAWEEFKNERDDPAR